MRCCGEGGFAQGQVQGGAVDATGFAWKQECGTAGMACFGGELERPCADGEYLHNVCFCGKVEDGMLVVSHNLLSMNADRQFHIVKRKKEKTTEKLSSGYRINRAADDAAGLSISEKMRNQIRGLNQAMQNVEDGINFIRVAEGAMNETHSILHRIEELAVRSANDVNSESDREALDDEVQELKDELEDIFHRTEFNSQKIFLVSYAPEIRGNPNNMQMIYTTPDKHGGYEGIKINGTKFTWERIGVEFQEDGVTFIGGEYTVRAGGETFTMVFRDNARVPSVGIKSTWEAKNNGIFINGKQAASWSSLRIGNGEVEPGKRSFTFHGMEITLDVQAGDDLETIIDGINNGDFHSEVSWSAYYSGTVTHDSAVDPVTQTLKAPWQWAESDYTDSFNIVLDPPERYLDLQSGANAGESTRLRWNGMNLMALGLGNAEVKTRVGAESVMDRVRDAVNTVSKQRAVLGAMQNRLESTLNNIGNYSENLQNAESRLRDTDMAREMVEHSKQNVLLQAGQAMIAQANQSQEGVLQLLQK